MLGTVDPTEVRCITSAGCFCFNFLTGVSDGTSVSSSGKAPMVGHRVSHANNKTKRRFMPNLQYRRFWVESENRWVRLRLTAAGLVRSTSSVLMRS